MSGGAVFGIHTCSSGEATARFVKLVEGTDALLPNEGRFAAAGIAAADAGPIPTVRLGRASVGPAAVDRPTTSSRTAGGGRRRPRRGGRSRVGVPFKIVGGHLFCACVFLCVFAMLSLPAMQCADTRQPPTSINKGCQSRVPDGIGAGKSFSLSRYSIQFSMRSAFLWVRWLGRATKGSLSEREVFQPGSKEAPCLKTDAPFPKQCFHAHKPDEHVSSVSCCLFH